MRRPMREQAGTSLLLFGMFDNLEIIKSMRRMYGSKVMLFAFRIECEMVRSRGRVREPNLFVVRRERVSGDYYERD